MASPYEIETPCCTRGDPTKKNKQTFVNAQPPVVTWTPSVIAHPLGVRNPDPAVALCEIISKATWGKGWSKSFCTQPRALVVALTCTSLFFLIAPRRECLSARLFFLLLLLLCSCFPLWLLLLLPPLLVGCNCNVVAVVGAAVFSEFLRRDFFSR